MTQAFGFIPKRNVEFIPLPRDPESAGGPPAVVDVDFVQAPWPHPLQKKESLCILQAFHYYIHEHMMVIGQDVPRFVMIARYMCDILGAATLVEELTRQDGKAYQDRRQREDGVSLGTITKELTLAKTAFTFNFGEERIKRIPAWKIPRGTGAKRRPMTDDEFKLLMREPMSWRLRMYNRLAYYTGHRARAIELLTWSRVDMVNWTIDFNEPGARIHNKRRVDGFPIPDALKPFLQSAWERRHRLGLTDPYVIGMSERGTLTSTYNEQKKWMVKAGIYQPGLVPRHSIRKNFVTGLVNAGHDWLLVAELIGDDPKTMRDHYLALNRNNLRSAVNGRT